MQLAHVSYVLPAEERLATSGLDWQFLLSPLFDPLNIALMGATAAFLAALLFAGGHIPALVERIRYFRGRSRQYADLIPFILRLAAGFALIGAGTENFLISPAISDDSFLATLEILLGFLMIVGFLLTPVTLAAVALVLGAFVMHPSLLGNLDLLATLIAILLLSQNKLGIDDLLGIGTPQIPEKYRSLAPLVLRFGIGIALVYLAITEKFLNPHNFALVVEKYSMTSLVPVSAAMWTLSVGIFELFIGLMLVLGIHVRTMSLIAFITLSLSFFFFTEAVFAHVTLFSGTAALILLGPGSKISYPFRSRGANDRE